MNLRFYSSGFMSRHAILNIGLCFAFLFGIGLSLKAQCFSPPNGYTLYSTTDSQYGITQTGFVTSSPELSGQWSINPLTDASISASFSDNSGRRSVIEIMGTGSLVVDNINLENFTPVDTCQHTYNVVEYSSIVTSNPALTSFCPLNIVVVLDESNSIEDASATQIVRDAVASLADNLKNSGSQMAVVEFATTADRVTIGTSTEFQLINDSFVSDLNSYLSTGYDPAQNSPLLIGGTNWEDALRKADQVVDANLIVLLTDGRPTFYNYSEGLPDTDGVAGAGDEFDITALKEARDIANEIKAGNKRLFVAALNFPNIIASILDISGNQQLAINPTLEEFLNSDYALSQSQELANLFSTIGGLCSPPSEPIPSVGTWGLICLALILTIIGIISVSTTDENIFSVA